MRFEISKTDYKALLELGEKCVCIVQSKNPSIREYNSARRLRLLIKKLERKNKNNEESI